jgi:hypothetical protein
MRPSPSRAATCLGCVQRWESDRPEFVGPGSEASPARHGRLRHQGTPSLMGCPATRRLAGSADLLTPRAADCSTLRSRLRRRPARGGRLGCLVEMAGCRCELDPSGRGSRRSPRDDAPAWLTAGVPRRKFADKIVRVSRGCRPPGLGRSCGRLAGGTRRAKLPRRLELDRAPGLRRAFRRLSRLLRQTRPSHQSGLPRADVHLILQGDIGQRAPASAPRLLMARDRTREEPSRV